MKRLICLSAVALALTVPIAADYASANIGSTPHIHGAVQFPQTRARIVRHTIRLHIPQSRSPVSHLIIDVPQGLIASNNITLTDDVKGKVNADFSMGDNQIIIKISQPLTSESKLKLVLNNVKIRGVSNAWLYRISAKSVGVNGEFPMGLARIPVY
ncbi:hypothetical protein QUA41_11355 [Microcoleus sp. Pol11C1]|uniref:hypothetical protein n=1 Tax=unclassified Microcoleus TaxID=2642155 RepID=UPI002FD10B66